MSSVGTSNSSVFMFPVTRHNKDLVDAKSLTCMSVNITQPQAYPRTHTYKEEGEHNREICLIYVIHMCKIDSPSWYEWPVISCMLPENKFNV